MLESLIDSGDIRCHPFPKIIIDVGPKVSAYLIELQTGQMPRFYLYSLTCESLLFTLNFYLIIISETYVTTRPRASVTVAGTTKRG